MWKKLIPVAAVVGAVTIALAIVAVGRAGPRDVFNSDHDLGSPGNPSCKQCHIPHKAKGDFLWARTPGSTAIGGDTGPLCFSCHDGTVAGKQYIFAPDTINHPMGPTTHLYNEHDPSRGCVACHDAHDPDFKFTWDLMRTGKPQNPDNANICLACHSMTHPTRGLAPSHPFDVEDPGDLSWRTAEEPDVPTSVVQMPSTKVPNLPTDQTFNPGAADAEGTRLWDSATRQTAVAAGQSGKLGCLSCHGPHGAVNEFLNTMTEADAASSHEPICENCHQ